MRILLAGGAGYIGSHTAVELIERNNEVIILDNYSNSDPEVLNRIKMITEKNVNSFNVDDELQIISRHLKQTKFVHKQIKWSLIF